MSRSTLAAFLVLPAALMLGACQGGGSDSPVASQPDRDACGARAYSDRIGKDHERYDFKALDRPVRIVGPDMAMTMDYRAERLNVDIDDKGRITRIWCG